MLPANMHVVWRVSHDAAFSLLNQLPHDFKRIAGVLEKLTQFRFVTRFLGLFIVLRVGIYFFGVGFLEFGTKQIKVETKQWFCLIISCLNCLGISFVKFMK